MRTQLPPEIEEPVIQSLIVDSLRNAYEISQERHDPELGDDAMIFGQHIWKSGSHFLRRELDGLPGCRAEFVNQSLDMQIGRVRLRHHKLGESEQDDPARCFPDHPGPAARLGLEQLEMELRWPEGRPQCLGWVIGSYGNPEDGLAMVCLQAVGDQRGLDGCISRWEQIVVIYQASRAAGVAASAGAAGRAATVVAPEPEVGLYADAQQVAQEERAER